MSARTCSPPTGQGDQEVGEQRGGARAKVNKRTAQTCSGSFLEEGGITLSRMEAKLKKKALTPVKKLLNDLLELH